MKRISLITIALIALMLMSSISLASPALTLNTVTWTNGVINISTKSANDDSLINMSHIAISFSASNTRNSSSVLLINITNSTATNFDLGYANFTFGSSYVLDDTALGSVTAVATGLDGSNGLALSATTVTIDQTDPSAPTSITYTNPVDDGDTLTSTIDRDNANRCWVKFGGNPKVAMTLSGSTCTYTVTNGIPVNSIYETVFSADDGTDAEAVAAIVTVQITATPNGGLVIGGGEAVISVDADGNPTNSAIGFNSNPFNPKQKQNNALVVAIVGAFVLYMVFKKK